MKEPHLIGKVTGIPLVDIAVDTLKLGKQALVFVSTKQSAEKSAEEIGGHLKLSSNELDAIAKEALSSLSKPTKQCERLAKCIKGGTAFHHSGLVSKQRHMIEEGFRNGAIRIICCTPTLAAGVDLPAFRAIIRDLKRFSSQGEYGYGGSSWIPVLEYLQMCGRAGRPSFDEEGQAILFASSATEEDELTEHYIDGQPEEIYSKLAVEPVLRTYLLSLIASRVAGNRTEIMNFFSKTFWAHQYKDIKRLEGVIDRVLGLLQEWEFIKQSSNDFVTASELKEGRILPTILGGRVAQLYLDPLTAHQLIEGMKLGEGMSQLTDFQLLQLISSMLEMRPLLRVKVREMEEIQQRLLEHSGGLLTAEPSMYEEAYDDFVASVKTALFLKEWIEEQDEEYLLQRYGTRPGEVHAKLENADWLLYSAIEIAKILRLHSLVKAMARLRTRVQYGVKEELLPLLQLKGIGRVRARKMFNNKIKDLAGVKNVDVATLSQILGSSKIAMDVKEQVGEKTEMVKEGKRKGQINLNDYDEGQM